MTPGQRLEERATLIQQLVNLQRGWCSITSHARVSVETSATTFPTTSTIGFEFWHVSVAKTDFVGLLPFVAALTQQLPLCFQRVSACRSRQPIVDFAIEALAKAGDGSETAASFAGWFWRAVVSNFLCSNALRVKNILCLKDS